MKARETRRVTSGDYARRIIRNSSTRWRSICAALAVTLLVAPSAFAQVPEPQQVPAPQTDPFYQPPSSIPSVPPGTILKSRAVSIAAPLAYPLPVQAWQLMYVSTDNNGNPSAVVATIIEPLTQSLTSPRPLVSFQMAIDGLALNCDPSYEMRVGTEKEEPSVFSLLAQGWVVVTADFEGLQSEYAVGRQAARGVLDGIRAAEIFAPAGLSGTATPVGLWGYSGGGQASAWASEQAPSYAPELNIVGVSEGGVPPDLTAVAKQIDGGPFSGVELAASVGLSRAYPQLTTLWNAQGQALAQAIGTMCIEQYTVPYAFQRANTYTTVPDAIDLPWVQDILEANGLSQSKPSAPIFIYHALNDELIPIATVDALVAQYCSEGVTVDYYQDPASDHNSLAITGANLAVAYLAARFAGEPAPNNCPLPSVPPL